MATKADGTIIINTKIDTEGIKEGVEATKKELSFGDIVKGSAIGSALANVIEQVVSSIGEIGTAMIESAATVKAENSQFTQTFQNLEGTARKTISGIAEESGILDTRLNTLGSQIYAFARSSGGTTSESMSLMEKSLQAAADGAAYYDRSLEDTTETLQSFLKGNFANDAALGVSATEATRNAEAMELFGKKYNDLSEIQKQQTLLQMVLDAQKLSGAMGQAAREADGWENVQGNLNESIRQLQAAAGEPFLEALIPVVKGLTSNIANLTKNTDWEGFSKGIESLVNSVKKGGLTGLLDTATEMGISFVDNIAKGIAGNVTSLINEGLPMILSFSESLRKNAGNLVDSGLNLLLQIAKGIIDGLPTMLQTIPQIVSNIAGIINDNAPKLLVAAGQLVLMLLKGLWDALPDLLMAIPDIIQAIVDVFTAFNWVNLGKNLMTFLKDGIKSMVGGIKTAATGVKDGIVNVLKNLPTQLKTFATNGMQGMINAINGLLSSLKSAAGNALSSIVSGISNLPSKLVSIAKNAITNMKSQFTSGGWKNLGKSIIDGIVAGISGAASSLFSSLKNIAKKALNSAKDALGIHSPSRKFRDVIGKMIPSGITEGIDDEFPSTIKALKAQTNKMLDTASDIVPNIMEYSMPVMATGTILPAGAQTDPYYSYLSGLENELSTIKAMLMQKETPQYSNEELRVILQLNRRVLFDEFIEEWKLRRIQSGTDPIPV